MKIEIKVKPRAKKTAVEKQLDGSFIVRVKEPATEGKANEAVIEAIAEYFSVPKSQIKIIRGNSNRKKLIEIG